MIGVRRSHVGRGLARKLLESVHRLSDVSHREPGGLSVRAVLSLVQETGGTLVGADVVEYNPRQDLAGVTAIVAAKIVKEVAGRMLADALQTSTISKL